MKKTENALTLDITEEIKEVQSLKITQINKFDNLLMDIGNKVYDTYKYILESKKEQTKIKNIVKEESEKMIQDLTRIEKQSRTLMDLLYAMEYESKNMDRLQLELIAIENEIPLLVSKLKRL